jgi:hypothetical protein
MAYGHKDIVGSAWGPVRLECPAQVRHVGLQAGDPPPGWVPAPHVFRQPVHRHDPVRLNQQQRQHRPLPRAAQWQHTPRP